MHTRRVAKQRAGVRDEVLKRELENEIRQLEADINKMTPAFVRRATTNAEWLAQLSYRPVYLNHH